MTRLEIVMIVLLVLLVTCFSGAAIWWEPAVKTPYDTQSATGGFTIRVTARREFGLGLDARGGIVRYEHRADDQSEWIAITSFRLPTLDPIPPDQIRFLDAQRAYFFHEFVFGITIDGGHTWVIRGRPARSAVTGTRLVYHRIDHVLIAPDGVGTMSVSAYPGQPPPLAVDLVTADFGVTWQDALSAGTD